MTQCECKECVFTDADCKDISCDLENVKPNRDNVRFYARRVKILRTAVDEAMSDLETLHSKYADKKGKPKLTKQLNAARKALANLVAAIREGGF